MSDLALLAGLRLSAICQGSRFAEMDTADAYLRGRQYASRRYDWDAFHVGVPGSLSLQASYYVPMSERRPSSRRDIPKVIVQSLTSMAFGREQWPTITVPGDPLAEDYVDGLVSESKLPEKLIELRWKGGASGTACMSFAFVEGLPRLRVHDAKHIHVLRWKDRDEFVIGSVIKVYAYERVRFVEGKPVKKIFYSVRYWDTEMEIVWDPVPKELADNGTWPTAVRSYAVEHGYGECPFYWCQNLPDSENEDGISDFDGMCGRMDSINYLASSTTKGTIANIDPTLVIKDDKTANSGVVRKGSDTAIYSKGGAQYLELEGNAVKAAEEWIHVLEQWCMDEAGVVSVDPHEIAAKAVSGEALKVIYMPMTAKCDILRSQYGGMIVRVIRGMLNAARRIIGRELGPLVTTDDGRVLQSVPTVLLPPKYVEKKVGDKKVTEVMELVPGTSSNVHLNWRSYFPPTPADISSITDSAAKAKGTLISGKTATEYVAPIYGVKDVDAELDAIADEKEENLESMFAAPGPNGVFGKVPPKGSAKDDDEGDE